MRAKINLFGHAVHPFLVVFPLGLLLMVPVFDLVHLATGFSAWAFVSFWVLTAGLAGALVASVVGLLDFLEIPNDTRAKRTGLLHLGVNLSAVMLFGFSWIVRLTVGYPNAGAGSFLLAVGGFLVMLVGGWLGNELVQRHGISISPGANLDARPSLRSDERQRRTIPVHHEPEPTL